MQAAPGRSTAEIIPSLPTESIGEIKRLAAEMETLSEALPSLLQEELSLREERERSDPAPSQSLDFSNGADIAGYKSCKPPESSLVCLQRWAVSPTDSCMPCHKGWKNPSDVSKHEHFCAWHVCSHVAQYPTLFMAACRALSTDVDMGALQAHIVAATREAQQQLASTQQGIAELQERQR